MKFMQKIKIDIPIYYILCKYYLEQKQAEWDPLPKCKDYVKNWIQDLTIYYILYDMLDAIYYILHYTTY